MVYGERGGVVEGGENLEIGTGSTTLNHDLHHALSGNNVTGELSMI